MKIRMVHIARVEMEDGFVLDIPVHLEAGMPPDGAYLIDADKNMYFIHENHRDPRLIAFWEADFSDETMRIYREVKDN